MKLTEKEAALEAILFTMGEAVETKRLAEAIGETPEKTRELLEKLRAGWEKEHRGVNLISLEDSWQMCTRSEFYDYLIRIAKAPKKYTLTDTLLETLSIIAYKQPVSKSEIESIRGVNCDYAIQKLLEKELVEIKGRSEGLGKPLLYGTSEKFFDYFGLRGVQDLPKLKDFELPENSIGVPSSEEVETPVMVDGENVHLETESIVLEDQNDEGPIPDIMNEIDEIQPEEENEIPSDIVE